MQSKKSFLLGTILILLPLFVAVTNLPRSLAPEQPFANSQADSKN